jgi:hypothetical protein
VSADDVKAALKFAAEAVNSSDFVRFTAMVLGERTRQDR